MYYYIIILSLIVQNVLTNEYVYPYPQLYDQQSYEYYKDMISVKNLRYIEPPQSEANPIKVQYDALYDEVHTKYRNSPKQINKKDSYKSLDDRIQKLKLTIEDPKTPKKKKILFGEIIKTYNKYKDGKHNDYEPNVNIDRLMKINFDQRTPKKYKKIYEEIISTYYRNRDLLERTYTNVNMIEDDLNNQFDSEKDSYNPDSEEYESEKDVNNYGIDILSKRNPRFVKGLNAWSSKINNSSTITPAPLNSPLSQLPQTRDTDKQLFIAPTIDLPFTDDSKGTETLENITEVLQKLNFKEKQSKLAAIIFQNLYSRISQEHNMNTDRKGHVRFKRDLNSEKNDAKESTVTKSTIKTNITEDISKICNCSEAKDGRRWSYGQQQNAKKRPYQEKLIRYIDEIIVKANKKLQPVDNIKKNFENKNAYEVGYIMSSIDTLVLNIEKLKTKISDKNYSGDDSSVLDVFDKVMIANKAIKDYMITLHNLTTFEKTEKMKEPEIKKELYEVGLAEPPLLL